jgi:hypothetical protein
MGFPYYLLLIAFVGYPIISLILVEFLSPALIIRGLKFLLPIFLLYNIFRLSGWSFTGDYFDYLLCSFEYLAFSVVVCLAARNKIKFPRAVRIFGLISFLLGFALGLSGIILFVVVSKEIEADRKFKFNSGEHEYQTRRYSSGFATFSNTKYIFKTYKPGKLAFLEKKIDETVFYDDETELKIGEDNLKIRLIETQDPRKIIFESSKWKVIR